MSEEAAKEGRRIRPGTAMLSSAERRTRPKRIDCLGLVTIVLILSAVASTCITQPASNKPQQMRLGSSSSAIGMTEKWSYATNASIYPSPIASDVDGDGQQEVLVGTYDAYVYCLNNTGGLKWRSQVTGAVLTLTVADLDGDGRLETIAGTNVGEITCLSSAGTLKWRTATGSAVWVSPTIVDLDSDGQKELLAGSRDHSIYCYNRTGGVKWSYATGADVVAGPAVVDVTGDGQMEVTVGSWDCNLYCLNTTGGLLWKYKAKDFIYSAPAIADIDGDGRAELLFGTAHEDVGNHNLYCLNRTGALKWTYYIGGGIFGSPAIADVDGDGGSEVLVGGWSPNGGSFCLSNNGSLKWRYTELESDSCTPLIIELDGDGQLEILYGTSAVVLNGWGGKEYQNPAAGFAYNAPAVADLDGDDKLDVIVASWNYGVIAFDVTPPVPVAVILALYVIFLSLTMLAFGLLIKLREYVRGRGVARRTRGQRNRRERNQFCSSSWSTR